jgi:hypothetical protein
MMGDCSLLSEATWQEQLVNVTVPFTRSLIARWTSALEKEGRRTRYCTDTQVSHSSATMEGSVHQFPREVKERSPHTLWKGPEGMTRLHSMELFHRALANKGAFR